MLQVKTLQDLGDRVTTRVGRDDGIGMRSSVDARDDRFFQLQRLGHALCHPCKRTESLCVPG